MEVSRGYGKKLFQGMVYFIFIGIILILVSGEIAEASPGPGEVWTVASGGASFPARYSHSSVVFDNNMWIIGGTDGSGNNFFDVWNSTDGVNWTQAPGTAPFPGRWGHSSLVFNDGSGEKMWVIGGAGDSGLLNDVWYSTDGDTWTLKPSTAPFPARYGHSSLVFNDGSGEKMWVIGGYGDDGTTNIVYLNDAWYSSDGDTWTRAASSSPFLPARNFHSSLVFDNKMWVIGGTGDTGESNDVWNSTDGDTWVQATSSSPFLPARYGQSSLVFDNKMWVIGGWGNSAGLNDVWNSTDGDTWVQATSSSPFLPARYGQSSLVFDNKMWVIGGTDGFGTPFNDVWYSVLTPAPTVTGITPASGINTHPVLITNLSGSDFITGAQVKLNRTGYADIPGTGVTVVSANNITCTFDLTGTPAGQYTLVVTNPDGQQGILVNGFVVTMNPPTVNGIIPATGVSSGTISITNLSGTNFVPGAIVMLNRTGFAGVVATGVTVVSPAKITCTFDLTGMTAGQYNVIVTNPDLQVGIRVNGFTVKAPPLIVTTKVANTTINGLTITHCGGPQSVTVNTAVLPAALIPNNSVLEIQPPADRGFKNITIYALNGVGFSTAGNLITGSPTGVHLVSEDIPPPSVFSNGIGSKSSFNFSIDLPSYPCNALLNMTIREGVTPENNAKLLRIASGQTPPAVSKGTAYTTKITTTNFPSSTPVKLHMSINSSWRTGLDPTSIIFFWRIADDGNSGQILPTHYLSTDPVNNLDYYDADSPLGMSTFGISAFTGNNNPFQLITLTAAAYIQPQNPVAPAINEADQQVTPSVTATKSPTATPTPNATTPLPRLPEGITAKLFTNADGVITQATTVKPADGLVTVSIGTGIVAKDQNGKPLASITLTPVPAGNLPGNLPGSAFMFAGRAYELQPDGAAFLPGISLIFTAPRDAQFGQDFSVKYYDRATGTWQDVPTRYDPTTGTITGQVSHLCTFALFVGTITAVPSAAVTNAPSQPVNKTNTAVVPPTAVSMFVGLVQWVVRQLVENIIIVVVVIILVAVFLLYEWKQRRELWK